MSGQNLRLNQPATSSREEGLELSYYWLKLPFTITSKFVLPVPQVKEPRPEKRAYKRKKKTAVITSSPHKSELEMKSKEKTTKLQKRAKSPE